MSNYKWAVDIMVARMGFKWDKRVLEELASEERHKNPNSQLSDVLRTANWKRFTYTVKRTINKRG